MASDPSPPYVSAPPSPAPDSLLSLQDLEDASVYLVDLLSLISYGVLVALILKDGWRAFRKRATWLPSTAFALSGLTVQIIAWWTNAKRITNIHDKLDVDTLAFVYQLALSGRVAVCVFIGYLLPGMAIPDLRAFVALAIAMCAQIGNEMIIAYPNKTKLLKDDSRTWLIKMNLITLICIFVLVLILSCVVLASKTIHSLLKERISAIFPALEEDEFGLTNEGTTSTSWNDIDDQVLKSWFVARVCQVDYVIARSVLSSAVFVVITICVVFFIMSNTSHNLYLTNEVRYVIFSPLFSFIIIGWFVICWRWLAAQLYFRPRRNCKKCLCVEDFWTRSIAERIHMHDLRRCRQRLQDNQRPRSVMRCLKKFCCLPIKMFSELRLHKLLYLVLMIQMIVVLLSKLCGVLSEFFVGRFVYCCRKHLKKGSQVKSSERYKRVSVASNKNYAEILKCVCMPGEDPSDLWEANEMSFKKLSRGMKKCCKEAKESDEINSFFSSFSLQWAEEGTQVLDKLKKQAMPSVVKHYPSVENRCVKITVVSLITIFIKLHKAKSDHSKAVLNACCGVWDLLSFENECRVNLHGNDHNGDSDEMGMAADRKLYALQNEHRKLPRRGEESVMDAGAARQLLLNLRAECAALLRRENLLGSDCDDELDEGLNDSKDWMKIAPSYYLYKLCKLMEEENIVDCVEWIETSLRNVIACFVTSLPDMIVKQCWTWAKEFEEDKIWEATRVAGKCRGMMEVWDLQPKFTMNTTKQWTIQVEKSAQFSADV